MFHGMPGDYQAPTRSQENLSFKAQESVASNDGLKEENCLQKCRQNYSDSMLQPPSEEGKQCSESTSVVDFLSLRGRRLSPHKKVSKTRIVCSDSCHSHDTGRGRLKALSFPYRKSPKKSCSSQNKGTDGGMAWMTLDGLLVNMDDTISGDVVKLLGHKEAVVWNSFSPLQKVLLVAVNAAAASTAKQRHTQEMRHLQLAIDKRDKDYQILREKMSQIQEHLSFWKEQAQNFCGEAKDIGAHGKVIVNENASPFFKLDLESTPKCDSVILEQVATPQIGQGVGNVPEHNARFRRNLRAASFKNSRYLGGCLSKERWNMSSVDDNNRKRTFLDRLSESPSLTEGLSEASTPQLPLTQLNKIFTPHLPTDNVSPKQNGRLSHYCQKGCRRVSVTGDSLTSNVRCATLILQLKNIMRQLINNEASEAMDAFASVKEKVQMLDSEASRQSLPSCQAIKDLKESADQASTKAILLQEAILSVWDVLVEDPQSNVPLSQEDACLGVVLTKNKDQILENQGMKGESFCRKSDAENNRLANASDLFLATTLDLDCPKNQEGDGTNVDSVIQFAVKNTVDNLLAPLSERQKFDSSNWSSEMVIEQLLGELESAAAKVASMEVQIKTLRNSQVLSQSKKEEAERNLAEVHLNLDMTNGRRQLQSEDSSCQDFTKTEQSGSHTCKELEATLELLKDAEKRFAACREACKIKEKAISKLEDEIAALQGMVSELQSLQATPKFVRQQDQASVQTFVTSNLLFNLDSPVKIESPQSSFSSWKGLDELSRLSDSLERESMSGSCDSEMYRLESVRAPQTDGYKDERGCITSVLQSERINNKHATRREIAEKSRRNRSSGEEARRNSSSTDELIRKSSWSSISSSSSTDDSGSGLVHHGRLPQVPKSYSNHARKPKFSNAADLRFPEDTGRRTPSSAEAAGGRRDDGTLGRKAGNVLSGVEPNTPLRDRKFSSAGKDKIFSQSVDNLNKAKENLAHRRRWI